MIAEYLNLTLAVCGIVFVAGGLVWNHHENTQRSRLFERHRQYAVRCFDLLFNHLDLDPPRHDED